MRRRTVLAATGLATSLGGCLGAPTAATSPDAPDASDLLEEVPLHITITNNDDTSHTVDVEFIHAMTPACRYTTPDCGKPTRRSTDLDRTVTLDPGAQATYEPAVTTLEPGDDSVDTYAFTVSTAAGGEATITGLEAGATATIGRSSAAAYPWRVSDRGYRLTAELTPAGTVTTSVGPLD